MVIRVTHDTVFVDTSFWIALLTSGDQNYHAAQDFDMRGLRIVTSELVLAELLNYFANKDVHFKQFVVDYIVALQSRSDIKIVALRDTNFAQAFADYQKFLDQKWGLVDCASFAIMRKLNIDTALTFDADFKQAGFKRAPEWP